MSGHATTVARRYLESKKCVLWGQSFDIITNQEQAVAWLANVLVEILELADTMRSEPAA